MKTNFGDVVKDTHPEDVVSFISHWYRPDDLLCLVGIPTARGRRLHSYITCRDLCESVTRNVLDDLCYYRNGMNMYFTVNPVKEELGIYKRGGNANIDRVVGIYVDIDVNKEGKKGVFTSQQDIIEFLNETVELLPTAVIDSGSGGLHCYWKLSDDGLNIADGSELQKAWWSYLNEKAHGWKDGRVIDRLVDVSRILRVPGTLRFPKAEETLGSIGQVRIFDLVNESYSSGDMWDVCGRSYRDYNDERAQRRSQHDVRGFEIDTSEMSWADRIVVSNFEEIFNNEYSWDDILEPMGWTFLREDMEGRREWARPGSESKSAVTDWEDSPHVMSLMSTSPETMLDDLKEDEVALTKFRVALRLHYDDNDDKMFESLKDWLFGKDNL